MRAESLDLQRHALGTHRRGRLDDRDPRSHERQSCMRTLAVPPGTSGLTVGFGAVWVVNPGIVTSSATRSGTVERIDGLSGRVEASVPDPR